MRMLLLKLVVGDSRTYLLKCWKNTRDAFSRGTMGETRLWSDWNDTPGRKL